jgi:quinol monooxygenase YgiN
MAVVLQVELLVRPGNEQEFTQRLMQNARASRGEPGCRQFEVLVDPDDARRMMLFEVYDDEQAFAGHQQTAWFKAYVAEAVPLLESRVRRFWKRV